MDKVRLKHEHVWLGLMYMVLYSLALTETGAVGKVAQRTVTPFQVVLIQNLLGLVCVAPLIAVRYGWADFKTRRIGAHLVRDLSGVIGFVLFFVTLSTISLTDAVLLYNTGPLFVPFIVWIWMRVRVPLRMYWGLIIGFVGVVLVLQPHRDDFQPEMLLGLLSGVLLGLSLVSVRQLNRTEKPHTILFYYYLVGTIIMVPLALWGWRPVTIEAFWLMIAVGAGMLMTQVTMVLAFQRGQSSVLAPLSYLTIVWSALLDWWVWNVVPTWLKGIGIVLVIVGGIISLLLGRPKPTTNAPQAE